MWDVVIVGARCAGAATALGLVRQGHRVLILDRASFPSDTLSTHFLWPRGASYLNRLGLLAPVLAETPSGVELEFQRDGIAFVCRTPLADVQKRLREVHGSDAGAVETYVSVRRTVLDRIVLDAARAAGAEFRAGVTVDELLTEDGRVAGVAGTGPHGERVRERARFVVGADGRASKVGALVGAAVTAENDDATFAYWSYFSGMPLTCGLMQKRGRLASVVVPTNFGANMTLVFGPKAWWDAFKKDRDANFLRVIDFVDPAVGARMRDAKREEKFYGIADQRAFKRTSSGPGWLLVGDAACIKDQCTAIGMTHAFRDAELAVTAVTRALSGDDAGAVEYAAAREADLAGYYEFVGRMAGMALATPQDLQFMRGLERDRVHADAFAAMYGDALRVDDFIAHVRPAVLASAPPANDTPAPDGAAVLAAGSH